MISQLPSLTDDPTVSIVIPARNEERTIEILLSSIVEQSYPSDRLEIVLVDGLSDDHTVARGLNFVESVGWISDTDDRRDQAFTGERLRLVRNPERTTPHAFNLGVEHALGDFVAIVGAHSRLSSEYVHQVVSAFRETGADVVGGCLDIRATDPNSQAIADAQSSRFGTGGAAYRKCEGSRSEADTVPFPTFPKSLWTQVGGFDEDLLRNQDDEFILRVRQAGGKVVFDPKIRATYFARSSLRKLWRQYFEYGRFRILTIRKRGRPGSLRPLAPLLLVPVMLTAILAMPRRRALGLIIPVGYLSACIAEGGRLSRWRPVGWIRSAAALVTMHWSYGLGEWTGVVDQIPYFITKRPSRK